MGFIHASVWLTLFFFAYSAVSNFYAPMLATIHSSLNILLVMVLFYSHLYLVNRFLERKKWGLFVVLSALIFSIIFGLRVFVNLEILEKPALNPINTLISPLWRIGTMVFLTSGFVWLFAIAFQLLMNRFKKERENLALINAQQAAQLNYLKAQINPHFLFNALNNIYSLTVIKSNDAPKMLLKLSDLLRYAIYEGQRETVSLKKEAEHIQKFIDLFQMKSEYPLSISFKTEGNLAEMGIEPMILIPIVENCFKHCDFETNETAFIEMILMVKDNHLSFSTVNTFNKSDAQKDAVGGVGLANINQRLALRYHDNFTFDFKEINGVFETHLKINLTLKSLKINILENEKS